MLPFQVNHFILILSRSARKLWRRLRFELPPSDRYCLQLNVGVFAKNRFRIRLFVVTASGFFFGIRLLFTLIYVLFVLRRKKNRVILYNYVKGSVFSVLNA